MRLTLPAVTYRYILFFVLGLSPALQAQQFYNSGIQEIRLDMPQKKWAHLLDSIKRINPEARLSGTAWINGARYDSVGVRYKGNSSYFRTYKETSKKLPVNIKLNYKLKNQKISAGDYTTLKLSNAFLDPSFIRDPLAYEVVRKYMPAPLCNFSKLYINNIFYGLYVNTESIDQAFIQKHFGATPEKPGYIVKCDPDQWQRVRSQSGCPKGENASLSYLNDSPGCYDAFYEVEDPAAWKYLMQLIKILNKKPDQIETVLDIDQTLWMLAINNAIVNLDSYNGSLSHNYYLWFDPEGVAHPLIWDLNMAFGGWRRNFSFEEMPDAQLIQYGPLTEYDNPKRPLIFQLLKNPFYRKIYLAHLRTVTNDWLKSGQINTRAQAIMREIDPVVKADSLKLYTYQDFQNSLDKTMHDGPDHVIGLRQLMDKRTEYLLKHPLLNKTQPTAGEAKSQKQGDKVLITVKLSNAKSGRAYYRADKMFAFKWAALNDAGTDGDATAGDGIYSALLDAAAVKHYYIAADNDEAAVTLPERASFEYLKVE